MNDLRRPNIFPILERKTRIDRLPERSPSSSADSKNLNKKKLDELDDCSSQGNQEHDEDVESGNEFEQGEEERPCQNSAAIIGSDGSKSKKPRIHQ